MTTATKTRKPAARTRTAKPDAAKPAFDPYQAVTDQILAQLEKGTAPWRMPWNAAVGLPKSLTTGKAYRGINTFLLQISAMSQGYESPYWATYKAMTERGGQVRKGEKGTLIIFWKQYLDKNEVDDKGKPKVRFVLRVFSVFNTEQADAIEGQTFNVPEWKGTQEAHEPIEEAEAIVAGYLANGGPTVRFGATQAAYSPPLDVLHMPSIETFGQVEEFYSTYFHELTHSTGADKRLNRPGIATFSHFGDAQYSKEELVAEMGSAFLTGQVGILPAVIENSANYLDNWIKALRGDFKLVVQAAAQAQKAADLIRGVSFEQVDAEPTTTA